MGHHVARLLDRLGGGRITANSVTIAGLVGHVPVALLIATGHHVWAALLFFVTMISDAIDGELARLQHSASTRGMLLDATADRIEEVLMYCGICYYLSTRGSGAGVVWVVAACGSGLCVSYVKAKGEVAIASHLAGTGVNIPHEALNQRFQVGVAGLKTRRYISFAGLLTGLFVAMSIVLTILSLITFTQRWIVISRELARLSGNVERDPGYDDRAQGR